MEAQVNQNESNHDGRTILQLSGIDKKWIRSASGNWIDLATINQPKTKVGEFNEHQIVDLDDEGKSQWWKFWKR